MNSIKEKAKEHSSEPRANAHCGYDEEDLKNSFEAGANYVLKQITEAIRLCDNDRNTDLYKSLWDCIEQLKK